jgi:hypothetical protein
MITEDYVSFETAKLLKEKGFDGECDLFGRTDESELIIREAAKIAYEQGIDDECVILPTLQMAMKWLREERKINIEIITYWTKDKSMVYGNRIVHNGVVLKEIDTAYNSYEQACEVAIKYCLENLI